MDMKEAIHIIELVEEPYVTSFSVAKDMALQAMKKQVQQKADLHCPVCGAGIRNDGEVEKYCHECGQKLERDS